MPVNHLPESHPPATIADAAAAGAPTMSAALRKLAGVTDRGLYFEDSFTPWSELLRAAAVRIEALRGLLAGAARPHVGVLLDNQPEFLHALHAAALSEIVVAGLNTTRRGPALERDARTADCAVILTDAAHEGLLGGAALEGIRVVRVDSPEWAEALERAEEALTTGARAGVDAAGLPSPGTVPCEADDLVALVFTSGTSGDPKAVRVTQWKIALPGTFLAQRFGLGAGDVVYGAMPLFHSNAIMVAWPVTVLAGASLALRRRFSASSWLGDVRRYGATFANYVGTPLAYVLATPERDDDADNPMRVVYGNEADADTRAGFARRFGVTVVDGFGSTEGGVSVSRTPDTPPAALGRLAAGVAVRDLATDAVCPPAEFDADGRLANPDEAIGELTADGAALFAGYYNDPAADAAKMRGGRFRSGDLAYVDAGGFVYFAGRASGWMRVDGENLGAAPIERALLRHPDVAEAAVYAIPSPTGVGDAVAAAVVLRGGAEEDEVLGGLAGFLAAQADLGPRQWPSLVRVRSELPRTASFKVVTRTLTALGRSADPAASGGSGAASDSVWLREGRPPAGFERL